MLDPVLWLTPPFAAPAPVPCTPFAVPDSAPEPVPPAFNSRASLAKDVVFPSALPAALAVMNAAELVAPLIEPAAS
jgi:hypothetical protein